MNRERFNWGLILFFLGGILLLRNLDIIEFYWRSVLRMWPVIIIIFGVNLLLPRKGLGGYASVLLTILALLFLGYQGMQPSGNTNHWFKYESSKNSKRSLRSGEVKRGSTNSQFEVQSDSSIRIGHLQITGGGAEYTLESNDNSSIFNADIDHSNEISYLNKHWQEDSTIHIDLNMNNVKSNNFNFDNHLNEVNVRLSKELVWTIFLTTGAGSSDFDLSDLKIQKLVLKGGASAFEAKLGMPLENSRIEAQSGAASIELKIPKAAACRIVVKSGLSSKNFEGFERDENGGYVTPGFATAQNKYTIDLRGGLSSFTVERYD